MDPLEKLEPLLDAESMRAVDSWAIEKQGVPSLELMEAAGRGLAEAVGELAVAGPIRILCGKGNNGGDGIVAARYLGEAGFEVELLLLWPADELSDDAAASLERFEGRIVEPGERPPAEALEGSGAIVDCIFGTGFDGEPREPARAAIFAANDAACPVVACDIASGVDASTGSAAEASIAAELTVTFHAAKLGHRIAPGKWRTGELRVVPIGIPAGAPGEATGRELGRSLLELAPARGERSNKFTSGEVFVVGGSRGMTGAVCMAAMAAIRAGAGYATAGVPDGLEDIFEVKLTEVMTIGLASNDGGLGAAAAAPVIERAERSAAVVLGPGLGRAEHSGRLVRELIPRVDPPLLLDADALNAIGTDLHLLAGRKGPTVITPHAGELSRLLGCSSADVAADRLGSARRAAAAAHAVVVLKGDDTIVVEGERVGVNVVAAPALATAGTGDVLSGTIGALLARGMGTFEAAATGVLVHARAGVDAAERIGTESVIATDVIDSLPAGLRA